MGDILGIFLEAGELTNTDNRSTLKGPMVLRTDQLVALACRDRLKTSIEPWCATSAQAIGIEAGSGSDWARLLATPIAQTEGDRILGMAGDDPDRHLECTTLVAKFDHCAILACQLLQVTLGSDRIETRETSQIEGKIKEPDRGGRAHQGGVIPGQLRNRLG